MWIILTGLFTEIQTWLTFDNGVLLDVFQDWSPESIGFSS